MSFYDLLRKELNEKLEEKALERLPRSYSMIGKIAIIKLRPELKEYKKEIGKAILRILPVKTVCVIKEIKGEMRNPKIEVIAGNGTETIHREHKCVYKIDIAKFMFSKGNKFEKLRIVNQIREGEVVIDMFAGIGYFTIPVAKLSKAKKVYAMDISPEAIAYLKENIKLNKVENKVKVFHGDCKEICRKLAEKGIRGDRIIMGYIFNTYTFFPAALEIAGKNAIIHYHFLAKNEEMEKHRKILEEMAKNKEKEIEVMEIRKIKSYAPRVYHMVMDLKIV